MARFIIVFRSPNARLHLRDDGRAVSSHGHAKKFSSHVEARKTLRRLLADHPVLSNYKARVEALNAPKFTVNPKTRAKKRRVKKFTKNPSGFSKAVSNYADELDRADDLRASFTGMTSARVLKVPSKPIKAGFAIGPLIGVAYRATRDGESKNYLHTFRKSSQPLLIADSDGKQLGIVGGQFQFTDRGIEDR